MIDFKAMEEALDLLDNTADEFAIGKADVESAEIACKRSRARVFLTSEGNIEMRKAKAETDATVIAADEHYLKCLVVFEKCKARRQRAEIFLDVWRSVEASRRKV